MEEYRSPWETKGYEMDCIRAEESTLEDQEEGPAKPFILTQLQQARMKAVGSPMPPGEESYRF